MKKKIILGLDIGTSSTKTTIIDAENGAVIENSNYKYAVAEVCPGIMPVGVYEDTVLLILSNVSKKYTVLSVGVSTQMYSLCADTKDGRIVYQWNSIWDRVEDKEKILNGFIDISGCPTDTIFPAYKLYCMSTHKRKAFVPYGLKEHIIQYLTGVLATDYTTASASGLFNIRERVWNEDFINLLGYSMKDMPIIKKHDETVGVVKKELSEEIDENIRVVPAMGDGPSASHACISISNVCCNLGSSMAVRIVTELKDDKIDPLLWTYAYDDVNYVVGGISPNGCSILNWAKDIGWCDQMKLVETGMSMFFPWLYGERTPFWSSDLCGTFTGISINTDKQVIDTTVVKGVGFTMCRIVESMMPYINEDAILVTAGGGVRFFKSLLEVIAGALPIRIGILNESDYVASYGAAVSAATEHGIKLKKDNIYINKVIKPTGKFKQEYKRWRNMAEHIAKMYSAIGSK